MCYPPSYLCNICCWTVSNCQSILVIYVFLQDFDRELCCKQLRYSGMMETIRIRRAGYPIRHRFRDFVDRYRILANGIGPSHKEDCRLASEKICKAVLQGMDFQLGRTKVFLKVCHIVYCCLTCKL